MCLTCVSAAHTIFIVIFLGMHALFHLRLHVAACNQRMITLTEQKGAADSCLTGRDGRSCCKGTRAPVYWPAPGAGSLVPETSQGSDTGHPPSCQSETEPPEDSLEDECRVFVLLDAVNGRAPSRTTDNVQHGAKILAPIRCPSKPHTTEKETEQGRNKSKSLIQDQCVNIVEQS